MLSRWISVFLIALVIVTAVPLLAQDATQEAAPEPELLGTGWRWQAFEGSDGSVLDVPHPENYTLLLDADNFVGLRIDCNSGSASYTLEGQSLTITPGVSTLMACPEGSLDSQYLAYLSQVATYVIEDGLLYLNLQMDGGNMIFAPSTTALTGVEWRWQDYQVGDSLTTTVPNPENYTLILNTDGSIGFRADCNVGNGSYTLEDAVLTITLGVTTLVACPPESLEGQYLQYLSETSSYALENGQLILTLADEGGTLRFAPALIDDVVGVEWQWQDFQGGDNSLMGILNPEQYTLLLNADGSLNVRADCNRGSGSYTLEDNQLTLEVKALTRAMCPPESLSQQYLEYLAAVETFVIEDGTLMLNLASGAGSLRFASS